LEYLPAEQYEQEPKIQRKVQETYCPGEHAAWTKCLRSTHDISSKKPSKYFGKNFWNNMFVDCKVARETFLVAFSAPLMAKKVREKNKK
jgi:hypothetical protein